MMNKQEELLEQFRPWFSYKIIEFITQGYESISSYDIATYFATYRWKKQKPENLFEQISQLNQLTINDYFDYESIMAQTSTEMTLDTIDLSDLLD